MEVPKKLVVDMTSDGSVTGAHRAPYHNNHQPADYDTEDDDDFEYDTDRYTPPKPRVEPTATLMTPPGRLTIPEIGDEERRRYMRENNYSFNDQHRAEQPLGPPPGLDSSIYRTPNDTLLRNINNFESGDPISITKNIRHLYNRVRVLEDELQTQHNRQIFIIGVLSFYFITRGVNWMYR